MVLGWRKKTAEKLSFSKDEPILQTPPLLISSLSPCMLMEPKLSALCFE